MRSCKSTSCGSRAIAAIQRPICSNSASFSPRVVAAGVPRRNAAGDHGRLGVERDHVFVGVDAGIVERLLDDLAGDLLAGRIDAEYAQIHQQQVVVGAAADDAQALSCNVRASTWALARTWR